MSIEKIDALLLEADSAKLRKIYSLLTGESHQPRRRSRLMRRISKTVERLGVSVVADKLIKEPIMTRSIVIGEMMSVYAQRYENCLEVTYSIICDTGTYKIGAECSQNVYEMFVTGVSAEVIQNTCAYRELCRISFH